MTFQFGNWSCKGTQRSQADLRFTVLAEPCRPMLSAHWVGAWTVNWNFAGSAQTALGLCVGVRPRLPKVDPRDTSCAHCLTSVSGILR